jgi:hypothetical protein
MGSEGQFPEDLGGKRDFDYITPSGRRLTEYEAVTIYTQWGGHVGGGLQTMGDFLTRPDGTPVFDPASTAITIDDWYGFRDPNQMWQRPYYVMQSEAEKSIERVTELVVSTGAAKAVDPHWIENGIVGAYFPFAHYEYGLFRGLNMAARESLSDSINNVLVFLASDKLRHAQAISIMGLDLESVYEGFDGTAGKQVWLNNPDWQPLRRLIEEVMTVIDWNETIVATMLAIEPLIGEPLRRLVYCSGAAQRRDLLLPAAAGTATTDWQRNARAIKQYIEFLTTAPGGDGNREIMAGWLATWQDKARPVAEGLFDMLETKLPEPGLRKHAEAVAEEEAQRVGADIVSRSVVSA